jgi:hypothetical protein
MQELFRDTVSYSGTLALRDRVKGMMTMDDLVQRLSEGDHPTIVGGPKPSLEDFKFSVEDMGYVLIKFVETQGGTDLGMWVDADATRFDCGKGLAHVEGTLTLNYVNVRCIADINLATLHGTGRIVLL